MMQKMFINIEDSKNYHIVIGYLSNTTFNHCVRVIFHPTVTTIQAWVHNASR